MNKIITKNFILALALFCFASNSYSQNLYVETPIYYGSFEASSALWYSNPTTASNGITIAGSTEKFVNGQRSAKISAADCSIYTAGMAGNVSVVLGGPSGDLLLGNIPNVAAGDYTFKVKVFIADKAPSQVFIYFAESNAVITAGNVMTIPLTGVAVGSWQTIQGAVTLNAYTAMKSSIRVRHQDYAGLTGASNIYFDNMELHVGGTSAVTNVNAPKFSVYTSKAKAVVTTEDMCDVRIYSISGKLVKSIAAVSGKTEFSTAEFCKGLYFAKVSANGYFATQKFIVQ